MLSLQGKISLIKSQKFGVNMKKNIALLLGGDSAEAVISVQSSDQMLQCLDSTLFEIYPVKITGTSWTCTHDGITTEVDRNDFSITADGCRIHFDCVVPMIHGTPGEDGRLQAYFDLMRIPYTTSGVLTSSLTFNKHACKTFLNSFFYKYPPLTSTSIS